MGQKWRLLFQNSIDPALKSLPGRQGMYWTGVLVTKRVTTHHRGQITIIRCRELHSSQILRTLTKNASYYRLIKTIQLVYNYKPLLDSLNDSNLCLPTNHFCEYQMHSLIKGWFEKYFVFFDSWSYTSLVCGGEIAIEHGQSF